MTLAKDEKKRRRYRKLRRQIRQAFRPRPSRFHRWHWYDWVFGALALALLIYGIVGIILWSCTIHKYQKPKSGITTEPCDIEPECNASFLKKFGTPLAISILVADFYMCFLMIFILFWLRYLRNIGYCIIIIILLVIGIIYFATIGGAAHYLTKSKNAMTYACYDAVTKELEKPGMIYQSKFKCYMGEHKCCGIRDLYDFKEWNKKLTWPLGPNDVPIECCTIYTPTANVNSDQNLCQNMGVLSEPPNSARTKAIIHLGCGQELSDRKKAAGLTGNEGTNSVIIYIWFGYITAILLLILLILLIILIWLMLGKWRRKRGSNDDNNSYDNPMEQEDLVESEIIPGTPAKSMMSESENTFYAP